MDEETFLEHVKSKALLHTKAGYIACAVREWDASQDLTEPIEMNVLTKVILRLTQ